MNRLLVVSHSGVVDVNRNIYAEIARVSGKEVHMIVPESWQGSLIRDLKFERADSDGSLKIHPLPVKVSGNGSLYFFKNFKEKLDVINPDVIFCDEEPWSISCAQVMKAKGKRKCFFTTKQNLKKKIPPPFGMLEKFNFKKSDFAFALTENCKDVLTDWKSYSKPVYLFPHGYDPKLFYPREKVEIDEFRDKIGIPKDSILIGYFGRLTEDKGIPELVDAIEKSCADSRFNNFSFLLAGSGELSEFVEKTFQSYAKGKAVHLTAIPHSEMGLAMSSIDALVLPSKTMKNWAEQFGRVLIEALASKAVLLGSDSGEIPHIVRASAAGTVFKEGSSDSILDSLGWLHENLANLDELKETAYQFAAKNYTNEAVAKKFCEQIGI